MKPRIIFAIIFAIVMMDALTLGANITTSPEYKYELETCGINGIGAPSQDQEYNVSSYRDYAQATADVIVKYHMNFTTGRVFHDGGANLTQDFLQQTSLASYYWAIDALSRAFEMTNNATYKIAMSRAANKMIELFKDPTYSGFYVNEFSGVEIRQTKRPGVQAYAYWALDIAESMNSSLDFSIEKGSAIKCLADMLYDPIYGGFFYYTMRNGSLNIPSYFDEAYPNDGKRLDHLSLGAAALYDAGLAYSNSTLVIMANRTMSFMLSHMKYYHDMEYLGLKLAVSRSGGAIVVGEGASVANSIVTDLNAMAIKALLKAYLTTGNTTYLDSATNTYEALLANNWDGDLGGWFTETVDGIPYDPLEDEDVKYYKMAEIQFQMILTLEDFYETTDSIYQVRLVIDTFELVLSHLWDSVNEGFMANGNQDWETFSPDWQIHYTSVQAQAVIGLERIWKYGLPIVTRVRVTPTNPRPQDPVHFSVTALDDDGIDVVYVNYSMNVDGNMSNGILPLVANPEVGGVYNNSIGTLENNTRVNFWVFANDTTGRSFIAGSYFFMVRTDTFPPVIQLHAIYPTDTVRVGDEVVVDMETYEFPEHSNTNCCEMWWRVDEGSYVTENMTPIGIEDDRVIWRIFLGQFNEGDRIAFFCLATDEVGNVGESRLYELTILGPLYNITPITLYQVLAAVGLIAAPGVGYVYAKRKRGGYRLAQREGKRDARRRARQRGSSRRRQ